MLIIPDTLSQVCNLNGYIKKYVIRCKVKLLAASQWIAHDVHPMFLTRHAGLGMHLVSLNYFCAIVGMFVFCVYVCAPRGY